MEKINSQDKQLQAILWMVCNCFMAASVLVAIKYALSNFPLHTLIALYHLVATIISIILVIYSGNTLRTSNILLHLTRGAMNVTAYFLYFYAASMTSLANVIALGYTDGILTCLFSFLILKEPLTKTQIINLTLSFIGAGMIISPDTNILNLGGVLATMSATLWGFANIITKKLSHTDSTEMQLFYSNFFTFLIASILSIFLYDENIYEILGMKNYLWIILLGLMNSIQFFALFRSLSIAKTGIIMPFFVVSVIFVHIYEYALFDQSQNFVELIGTGLVIIVSVYQIFSLRTVRL